MGITTRSINEIVIEPAIIKSLIFSGRVLKKRGIRYAKKGSMTRPKREKFLMLEKLKIPKARAMMPRAIGKFRGLLIKTKREDSPPMIAVIFHQRAVGLKKLIFSKKAMD